MLTLATSSCFGLARGTLVLPPDSCLARIAFAWHSAHRARPGETNAFDRAAAVRLSTSDAIISDMTWLFPEPDLAPGEAIEWKAKAQFMPDRGRSTTGVLYLTNRHLFFVPGRGTPKQRATPSRYARADFISARPTGERFGSGLGSGAWKPMRVTLNGGHSFTVAVRPGAVAFLESGLQR